MKAKQSNTQILPQNQITNTTNPNPPTSTSQSANTQPRQRLLHPANRNQLNSKAGAERESRQTIKTFQEKGAISPETALTAKELGLSRIFVRIMERRKEQTKIFVEVNGKYYLDQKALEEKKQ